MSNLDLDRRNSAGCYARRVMIKLRTVLVTAFCAVMFSASFYLLAFGGAVLCCVPVYPGRGFWQTEKFFYGLLPMCTSVVLLVFTARFLARIFIRRRNAWLAGCILAGLSVAVDLTLFMKHRGTQDDQIRLNWESDSGIFSWGSGEVRLPTGFIYQA